MEIVKIECIEHEYERKYYNPHYPFWECAKCGNRFEQQNADQSL
jgi:hydrogenase maturation factor HypF (carbamoyltransferase family)